MIIIGVIILLIIIFLDFKLAEFLDDMDIIPLEISIYIIIILEIAILLQILYNNGVR